MGFLGGVRDRLWRPTGPKAVSDGQGSSSPATLEVVSDGAESTSPTASEAVADGPVGSTPVAPRAPSIRGLWRASCPTVCPVCDAAIDPSLARAQAPRCPQCARALAPVRVAGLWRRAAAGLVDGVVLLCTAGLLNLLLLAWLDPAPLLGDARGLDALLRVLELDPLMILRRFVPALVMSALYFGLFWSLSGQTLGHRVLRLRVIDPHGRPPRPWRAAVRVLGHGLGLAMGATGWLWVAFDREKRGLHDHLARTYVVRES
jgi:uncharacterized RDD family membrane protein YckC